MTLVGESDTTIRTFVPIPIRILPYRKALIAKLFFHQILGYADSPSIFVRDLVSTVASYFDTSTAMSQWEVEIASLSIRGSIFCVANMSGVGFLDYTGKSVTISDPDNYPRDVSYFTFLSYLNPNTVDPRALNAVHQFEFSLRLLLSSPSPSVNISLPSASVVTNKSSETTFNVILIDLLDDQLNKMSAIILRVIISIQRDSISASATSTTTFFGIFHSDSSTTTVAINSTPKMDMF